MTTVKIELPDEQAAVLKAKATAQGLILEGWFQKLARQETPVTHLPDTEEPVKQGSVVERMREIRARVKPDPEGWTTRDYINYGRR